MSTKNAPNSFSLPVLGTEAIEAPAAPDAMDALLDAGRAAAVAAEGAHGKSYWRSIEEKLQDEDFVKSTRGEFPEGADLPPSGVVRRDFLQLLGASMALAGVGTACSTRPADERMVAYTKVPDSLSPGIPQHYASALDRDGLAQAILVQAWEGRPTKIEGNPEHPVSRGATHTHEQARLMDLYSPARAQATKKQGTPKAFRSFTEELTTRLVQAQADGGAKLHFLLEPSASPLLAHLQQQIQQRFPSARFHAWSSGSRAAQTQGAQLAFGRPLEPHFDFARADVVLGLDSDFLQQGASAVRHMRDYANRRDPAQKLNRHYQVESNFSVTGAKADHRLRVRSADVAAVGQALAGALGVAGVPSKSLSGEQQKWVATAAADLKAAGSRALVVAGERQPAAVHALAYAINSALGSVGTAVQFSAPLLTLPSTGVETLSTLAKAIQAGQVDTLLITAHDPVYGAPVDLDFAGLLAKVPNVIYTSLFEDSTSRAATWFVPATHPLEAWGDNRAPDGTVTLTQPLINPLYPNLSQPELLALFLSEPYRSSYQLLRDLWRAQVGAASFEPTWEKWVQQGFAENTAATLESPSVDAGAVAQALGALPQPKGGMELNFRLDDSIGDGRYFQNPFLQELPDPMTKIVWDNAALVSPATAQKLGVVTNDVVELVYRGKTLEAPVFILPSHADEAITLSLGYGQTGSYRLQVDGGEQTFGVNANLLRHSDALWFDGGLEVRKTRKTYELAQTQTHWTMEDPVPDAVRNLVRKRPIALESTVAAWASHPGELTRPLRETPPTLLGKLEPTSGPPQYQWGMAIDLARCTGCNACVIACQVENNIPVVGREQVRTGREMHWLRIDRYFSGEMEEATAIMQPVACVHCEKAPCEYVCPVNATVHSDEGLNLMVYNRCVGTRYCSNNCPYKVRRFNYLHYTNGKTATERMSMNPDVTVRARGVIEKCSYCVHRIERARITTRVAAVTTGDKSQGVIREGTLKTACQQVCPAGAITFGDVSNKDSRVSKAHADERSYRLLNDLGTLPRTRHMVRLTNPNPALEAPAPAHSEH